MKSKYSAVIYFLPAFVSFFAVLTKNFDLRYIGLFGVSLLGGALILYAKLKQRARAEDALSLGVRGMLPQEKAAYYAGYILYFVMILAYARLRQ